MKVTMLTVCLANMARLKPGVRVSWPGSGGQHVIAGAPYPDPRDKVRVLVECICPPSDRKLLVALPVMIEVHDEQQ